MKKLLKRGTQFFKFGLVGISNTLLSQSIYAGLVLLGAHPQLSNFLGFALSVLNSYFWNNKYVFQKSSAGHLKPLLKTYIAYGGTYLLSALLLPWSILLMQWLLADPLAGKALGSAPILLITIPLNFLINKYWAFR